MPNLEAQLSREFGIRFLDARALATDARVSLGITGYPSPAQAELILLESRKMFYAKPDHVKHQMRATRSDLELAKVRTSSSANSLGSAESANTQTSSNSKKHNQPFMRSLRRGSKKPSTVENSNLKQSLIQDLSLLKKDDKNNNSSSPKELLKAGKVEAAIAKDLDLKPKGAKTLVKEAKEELGIKKSSKDVEVNRSIFMRARTIFRQKSQEDQQAMLASTKQSSAANADEEEEYYEMIDEAEIQSELQSIGQSSISSHTSASEFAAAAAAGTAGGNIFTKTTKTIVNSAKAVGDVGLKAGSAVVNVIPGVSAGSSYVPERKVPGNSVEAVLKRDLEIQFLDARAIVTEAKLNLGIQGYPSAGQNELIYEECMKVFYNKPVNDQRMMRAHKSDMDLAKASISSSTHSHSSGGSYDQPLAPSKAYGSKHATSSVKSTFLKKSLVKDLGVSEEPLKSGSSHSTSSRRSSGSGHSRSGKRGVKKRDSFGSFSKLIGSRSEHGGLNALRPPPRSRAIAANATFR